MYKIKQEETGRPFITFMVIASNREQVVGAAVRPSDFRLPQILFGVFDAPRGVSEHVPVASLRPRYSD